MVWIIAIGACGNSKGKSEAVIKMAEEKQTEILKPIEVGASQLDEYLPKLLGKKVALMVNQTSTIGKMHIVDTLLSKGVNIVKIFAPEHGFRGDHSAGAHVKSTIDEKTGLPIASLYGATKKPTAEMLKGVEVIVFDIQDVGVRFYTYISSMHYLMEACAENSIAMMVLDRPNPNGHYVDGPVLDIKFKSFIGMHPVPLVHGMTVGEFANMINGENWLTGGTSCQLEVIKCKNYTHDSMYQLPIRPSPNLPTMASVYLYPSLGLFEGTVMSIGRGTEHPFELLGKPNFGQGDFVFTPHKIPGVADEPKFENQECKGFILTEFANTYIKTNKKLYLEWLRLSYQECKTETTPFFISSFDKLAGNDVLQKQIKQGLTEAEIRQSWQPKLNEFKELRKKYLLY
ncbi:MAG: DUF1343 domain-containing protein [Flavobacteriales bacterium]|nr:DUF1343 domain-containing protein [Flavobacteriales bacterium]